MEEPGEIKMNNFKQRCDHATAVKGKPMSEPTVDKIKQQEEKIQYKRMLELLTTVKQMKEQITQTSEIIALLCEKEGKMKMKHHAIMLER